MDIRHRLVQIKRAAVEACGFVRNTSTRMRGVAARPTGFIREHPRASIALAAALLIIGPMLTGSGGGAFLLNMLGLGVVALLVRRIMRANARRKGGPARRANRRCRCHHQQPAGQ